jgi:DNA-binding HxlR family transcriptional regulator
MADRTYGQFCPVAVASEILCARWTPVLLRELLAGSTRFNELRRGLPRISPALLSQRLKELEEAGIVARTPSLRDPGVFEYRLTPAGEELKPLVDALGRWGQRWISSELSLRELDASLLMWDMRRNLRLDPPSGGRRVIQFRYPDAPPKHRSWWLVITSEEPDLCMVDPGFDVDLYVTAPLRTMTAIWMGLDTIAAAQADDRLRLAGDDRLASSMQKWLLLSPFAARPGRPPEPLHILYRPASVAELGRCRSLP